MSLIGLMALAANLGSVWLLMAYKDGDANVRSVWLCSRNDIIANLSVLVAATGVWLSDSQWPDVVIGIGIALVFFRSATHVLRDAILTAREK